MENGPPVPDSESLTIQPSNLQPLILLAEDNPANVDAMSDFLSIEGYRVILARNGAEAIERARKERLDLILMDIRMPGLDGLEAIRRIRANADASTGPSTGLTRVPIIALTALAVPGQVSPPNLVSLMFACSVPLTSAFARLVLELLFVVTHPPTQGCTQVLQLPFHSSALYNKTLL